MVISASIVAYSNYDEVCSAVRSILRYTPEQDFRLYVIDNASPDGTGQRLVQTDFSDARVSIFCLPQNLGFGRGHNYVMDRLESDVHFILNPDILLTEDTLSGLAEWLLARPEVVMATPQLYFPDGRVQNLPRRKPSPLPLVCRQFAPFKEGSLFERINARYTMEDQDLSQPTEIQFCTGSFMAVRTDIFRKAGGFDPKYFMYVEDADLTQKFLQYGKVYLVPQFTAIHAWHRDTLRDMGKFKMQLVSMLRFFRKWGIG